MKPEDILEAAADLATAIAPYLPPPVKGPVQIVGLLVKDALGASHQVTTQNGIALAAAGQEANRQSHFAGMPEAIEGILTQQILAGVSIPELRDALMAEIRRRIP